jgi:hypothetical protein
VSNLKTDKQPKQLTFDSLNAAPKKQAVDPEPSRQKQISVTQMETTTGIDELTLKIGFRLLPSRLAFSKIKTDLFFDGLYICSALIRVLQGPLATDESEYTWVLNMKDVSAGVYKVRVEMYEVWSSGERLSQTSRETTVDYVPLTRQSRLVRIPTVKSVAGADLAVASSQEKELLSEIKDAAKKEQLSRRDNY